MIYNVFNTEQEAMDAESIDFKIWLASRDKEPYKTNTLRYADIKEMKDGRFAYLNYDKGMQIYQKEELTIDDFV